MAWQAVKTWSSRGYTAVSSFESEPLLCPVVGYREYTSRTLFFRRSSQNAHLQILLTPIKPRKPVDSSTIARWIKGVLLARGVDVLQYSTLSSRGAATYLATKAGISNHENMERAECPMKAHLADFSIAHPGKHAEPQHLEMPCYSLSDNIHLQTCL